MRNPSNLPPGTTDRMIEENVGVLSHAIPEMVERVAQAISPNWRIMSANDKRNARITARAAIAAMREPTEAIQEAMTDAVMDACDMASGRAFWLVDPGPEAWEAGIKTALGE